MVEWTAKQCAEHWGVGLKTWHGYVARQQAPPAVRHVGRTPLWDAETVRTWKRPGAGARTDLIHETDGRGVCREHGHFCSVVRSPLLPDFVGPHAQVEIDGGGVYTVSTEARDGDGGLVEVRIYDLVAVEELPTEMQRELGRETGTHLLEKWVPVGELREI